MEKVKILNERLEEIRERMQAINDKMEVEKRNVPTDEETRQWDSLKNEAEQVKRALYAESLRQPSAEAVETRMTALYTNDFQLNSERAVAGERLRELFNSRVKTSAPVSLREIVATTSVNVEGAVPVFVKDFVEPLEKGLIFDKVGMKILTGLSGDVKYPIAPYIEAVIGSESMTLPDTTITLRDLKPNPKHLGVTIPFTGFANVKTNGALYTWTINAVTKAVARTLNIWMFQPTAVTTDTYGVFAYNESKNPILEKPFKAATPTYKELLSMRGAVMSTGAYNDGTYAYVMSGQMYSDLEATPINANGGDKMILQDGRIGGVPVFITEEIERTGPNTYNVIPKHVGFGRFSDCMAHQFGDMRLIVDPFSGSTSDVTRVTLNTDWAIDLVRAKSFVLGTVA